MALLPASQAICAPSSAASVRLLPTLPGSLHPSALLPLSCSLYNPHAQDSLHAHNASSPSHTLHAPSLSLFPLPSPPAHYQYCQRNGTSPLLSSPIPS